MDLKKNLHLEICIRKEIGVTQKITLKLFTRYYNKKKPDDYVIATGKQYSIKQFVNLTASNLNLKLRWVGKGLNEKALSSSKKVIIDVNKKYFRPLEVDYLKGSYLKAKKVLKWEPKIDIKNLIDEMITEEKKKQLKLFKLK